MYMLCSRCHPAEQKRLATHQQAAKPAANAMPSRIMSMVSSYSLSTSERLPPARKKSKQNTSQYCMRQKSLCSLKMLCLVVKFTDSPKWTMRGTWPRKDALLGGGEEVRDVVVDDDQASAGSTSTATTSCSRSSWPRASTTTRRPRFASETP